MNDLSGETSSSLALVEKRPQRPGGCVGIFFQLFDWNRRLAKKKLFSKKLLPPARAKRASKKFGGDEKLPMAKLLLIADENCGGFPNTKKHGIDNANGERNHETRSPGLVARLMGLDSMPDVRRDKLKKTQFPETNHDQGKNFVDSHGVRSSELFGCGKEDLNSEKGHTKLESRPQKLQKTGVFERRPVTRFGAEALHFKGVLSRSRKHHPKIASPVKSPRILSGRNASRLVEVATKILEPGLQPSNRAKCALTYSASLHPPLKDEVMTAGKTVLSPHQSEQSNYYARASKSLKGQSSCGRCDNFDVVDFRSNVEGQASVFASSVSKFVSDHSQGSGRGKGRPPISSLEQETEVVVLRKQDQPVSLSAQAKANFQIRSERIIERKPLSQEDQDQHHKSRQQCKSRKDVPSSIALKHRTQRQNQLSLGKDKVPPMPKLTNLQSRRVSYSVDAVNRPKDYIALNRNASSCTRPRMPSKAPDNCKIGRERNSCDKEDDSSSQPRAFIRKRRPISDSGRLESKGGVSFTKGDVTNGKATGLNAHSMNCIYVKSRLPSQGECNTPKGNTDTDIVSFTFSSPMRHSMGPFSPTKMEERRRVRDELIGNSTSQQNKLVLDEIDGNSSMLLRGDALGALLEQKLKELSCQDGNELENKGNPTRRSTDSILHVQISDLTVARPISQEDGNNCSVEFHPKDNLSYSNWDPSGCMLPDGHMFNTNRKFLEEAKRAVGASAAYPPAGDGDHPSPASVLEASFSNDSCFSGSLDDSSIYTLLIPGHKMQPDTMDCSCDQPEPSDPDTDLSDSATSWKTGRAGSEMVTDFVNHISSILNSIDLADIRLTGSKLNHAKEVILNAELLFGNAALCNAESMEDFLIAPFLLDKLEALADALWRIPNCILGFMEVKDTYQFRSFLSDSMIECLDSKYGRYCISGFKVWTKLPLCMNTELLIREVYEDIRKWTDLAGKTTDEIIDREMSHSLGKWTDFEIEAFEMGAEVERDILQVLVNEMVIDLSECRVASSQIQ
ncbi:hypothetical protein HHK36_014967 [Tetracentron sinense]|uniref:DUF4378 domain-containing protein n=1 Tax=Tetracentron sinense TaxID=13715 RepID=A0A834Z5C1_TETSI|nr:hypothetical protein HHK36_014967 [Tetracentron sinense]